MGQPGGRPSVGPHRVGAAAVGRLAGRGGAQESRPTALQPFSSVSIYPGVRNLGFSPDPCSLFPTWAGQQKKSRGECGHGRRLQGHAGISEDQPSIASHLCVHHALGTCLCNHTTPPVNRVLSQTPCPPPSSLSPAFGVGRGEEPAFLTVSLLSKGQGRGQQQIAESGASEGCCCWCCQASSVVSNSVRPLRRQPTWLPCPWDSPGKNTGVGFRVLDGFKFCCF